MESIHTLWRKSKYLCRTFSRREDIFIMLLIVLVGTGGFGLGRLSKIKEGKEPVKILNEASALNQNTPTTIHMGAGVPPIESQTAAVGGAYVASKSGAKYHYPWCAGAQSIKEENKIWFATREDAERAGYAPAANCKGL